MTRKLLRTMFLEYARAVYAKFHRGSGNAGVYMQLAYTLANTVHDELVGAQRPLASMGCDVAPLLSL